ncbi:MAG: aminodeoxychorismate/anthranilate synthase component II [Phycisphaerales bacterium]|nr:aminodeoxychorismate/anthranilate synthase component II [Phycisphaerales bacterium]
MTTVPAHPASRPRVLVVDNYDSFTYNLVQLLLGLGANVKTCRNDAITIEEAERLAPTHLVISPGPGGPREAGVSMAMIGRFAGGVPVLGVCLGHQAMAEVFGGRVSRAPRLMHGKASLVTHDGLGVYAGLPSPLEVGRYHSLAVQADAVPRDFVVTSRTDLGEVMGIRHVSWPVEGVQFHPESVLTPRGPEMIRNFLVGSPVSASGGARVPGLEAPA